MKKFAFLLSVMMLLNCVPVMARECVYGDADGDGVLTAGDSAIILQKALNDSYKMGIEDIIENYMSVVDVNVDDKITAIDSAVILQKVLNGGYVMPVEAVKSQIYSLDAEKFDIGIYTSDIVLGSITISATEKNPVSVQDIIVYKNPVDTILSDGAIVPVGETEQIRCMIINDENTISVKTGENYNSIFEVNYLNVFSRYNDTYSVDYAPLVNINNKKECIDYGVFGGAMDENGYYNIAGCVYLNLEKSSEYILKKENKERKYLFVSACYEEMM